MRVTLDATPLLGTRTGIGRYVEELLLALAALDAGLELTGTAFTWRGLDELAGALPPGVRPRARRAPARLLRELWARTDHPRVERLSGPAAVLHATNFVLPPSQCPGVVTVHDLSFLRTPATVTADSARYRHLVPRSISRAAVVIAISQAVAEEVEAEYPAARGKVVVTPLAADPAWARAEPADAQWLAARGLPPSYAVFVGTLEPRKNLPLLLQAYRALPADAPPLVLAGPPGWGEALDLSGLAGRVVLTGYLRPPELRRLVAAADLMVFPSTYEGFGLPPLEALAAGTPVVASDLPVTREVLGRHARFAPADDPEALSASILASLSDHGPTTREERRAHAAEWTWERTARLTLEAYERALGS